MTREHRRLAHIDYRWIALSNTSLSLLMAMVNGSVVLIALPSIFRGIGVNPLAPGESNYLLWMIMGYTLVTATVLVTAGRISDIFGRVRLYNAGFAIFTIGSILCFAVPGTGNTAALLLIVFRCIQGIGGAFLMANSAAILTDAFPPNQRGFAMGVNQIAGLAGGFAGLLIGGVLSTVDWRAIFLLSVPFGIFGTVWAYLMLHETQKVRVHRGLDIRGNLLFAGGLTLVLVAFTYAIQPYGTSSTGWGNPWVIGELTGGIALLALFVLNELHVPDPMFHLELFRIRAFTLGNIASFLAALSRGGLQFVLIIWLQGIWLPLHGYSYEQAPLMAALFMLPLTVGFLVAGPVSGRLSDRHGAHLFATGGMVLSAVGFLGMLALPADFSYMPFGALLFVLGVSQGNFAAPNTTAVMNASPAEHRGVASGMRATFMNVGQSLSMTLMFTLVVTGLSSQLGPALLSRLTDVGVPASLAHQVAGIPPIGALFAAFLGSNPMGSLLPHAALASLTPGARNAVLANGFFPGILEGPFADGLKVAFIVCIGLSLLAAVASWHKPATPVHHPALEDEPVAAISDMVD